MNFKIQELIVYSRKCAGILFGEKKLPKGNRVTKILNDFEEDSSTEDIEGPPKHREKKNTCLKTYSKKKHEASKTDKDQTPKIMIQRSQSPVLQSKLETKMIINRMKKCDTNKFAKQKIFFEDESEPDLE